MDKEATFNCIFLSSNNLIKMKTAAQERNCVTYRVHVGEVVEKHLSCAHFVPHSSHGPVLAADIDSFVAEEHLSLGTGVQKQVIGFAAALVFCHHQTVQMAVGLAGGRWAPLPCLWTAGAARAHWVHDRGEPGCFILEHLRQDPATVGWRYSKPHCFPCVSFFLFPFWSLHGKFLHVYIPFRKTSLHK